MEQLHLKKINSIQGKVILPGSKSLSNRALLLAATAYGKTTLYNVLQSADTARMIEALPKLGVELVQEDNKIEVSGINGTFRVANVSTNPMILDLGNAGTAMRPLCAVLAASEGCFELTGEPRMFERPIGPLAEALKTLGAEIEYLKEPLFPPVRIKGRQFISHEVTVDGSVSSQFLSALLMLAPLCGGLTIKVAGELISKPYIDLTVALIEKFGAKVSRDGYRSFNVASGGYRSPTTYLVEGDASSATYFAAAAAVAGKVEIFGLGRESTQGDANFMQVLQKMGASVSYNETSITVEHRNQLDGIEIDMNAMPDAAMTLVPLALYTKGPVTITNIESWRVKETDRIEAMANEMRKLGVMVKTGRDFISIDGSQRNSKTPEFDTYNDHRMAMCMSLTALDRDVIINDPACTAKTFPTYFKELEQVAVR